MKKDLLAKLTTMAAAYPRVMAEAYDVEDATPFSGVMLALHFDTPKEADGAAKALDDAGFYSDATCEDELCVYTGYQSPDQAIAHVQRVLMGIDVEMDDAPEAGVEAVAVVREGVVHEAGDVVKESVPHMSEFFGAQKQFEFVGTTPVSEEDDSKEKKAEADEKSDEKKAEAEDDSKEKKTEADDDSSEKAKKAESAPGPEADELMTKFFGASARFKGGEVGKNEAGASGDTGAMGQDANEPGSINVKGGEVGKNTGEADDDSKEKPKDEADDDSKEKKTEADDSSEEKKKAEAEDDSKEKKAEAEDDSSEKKSERYEGAVTIARLNRITEGSKVDGYADVYLDENNQIVAAEAYDVSGKLLEKFANRAAAKAVFGKAFGKGKGKSSERNKKPKYYQKFRTKYAKKHGLSASAAAVGNRKKGGKKNESVSPLAVLAGGLAESGKPVATAPAPKGHVCAPKAHVCEKCVTCVPKIRFLQNAVARLESQAKADAQMIEALNDLSRAQGVEMKVAESVAAHPELARKRTDLLKCESIDAVDKEVASLLGLIAETRKPPAAAQVQENKVPAVPAPKAQGSGASVQSSKTEGAPVGPITSEDVGGYFGESLKDGAPSSGDSVSRVVEHRRRQREKRGN